MNRRQFIPATVMCAGALTGVIVKLSSVKLVATDGPDGDPSGQEAVDLPSIRVRAEPVSVTPYQDLVPLVPAGRVATLLSKLTPCWDPIKTGKVTHAFRLWGADAEFPANRFARPFSSLVLSGRDLLGYLLNDVVYGRFAPGGSPLLYRSHRGIHVRRTRDPFAGTFTGDLGHADDMLAACGEIGLPSTMAVVYPDGVGSLGDVIRGSVAEFTMNQELEWTVEAFARYLENTTSWVNRSGEVSTFDQIASQLVDRPFGEGVCLGTHVLNALACLFRIDQVCPILSPRLRDAIPRHLKEASMLVTASRMDSGFWAGQWAPGVKGRFSPASQAVLALASTGHHLEWMAIVPPELRPDQAVIRLAVSGVLSLVEGMTPYERNEAYLDLTHLGRALSLMLGQNPSKIVNDIQL